MEINGRVTMTLSTTEAAVLYKYLTLKLGYSTRGELNQTQVEYLNHITNSLGSFLEASPLVDEDDQKDYFSFEKE